MVHPKFKRNQVWVIHRLSPSLSLPLSLSCLPTETIPNDLEYFTREMTTNLDSFVLVLNKPRFRTAQKFVRRNYTRRKAPATRNDRRTSDVAIYPAIPSRNVVTGTRGKANCCNTNQPGREEGPEHGGEAGETVAMYPVCFPYRHIAHARRLAHAHTARPDSQPRKRLYPFPASPTGDGECQFWARLHTRRIR